MVNGRNLGLKILHKNNFQVVDVYHVRFSPDSGHNLDQVKEPAFDPTRTLDIS